MAENRTQYGFTLLELLVVLAVGAVVAAVVNTQRWLTESETLLAQGMAQYLMQVRDGLVEYQRQYFAELAANTAVSGVATVREPTVAELKALHFLPTAVANSGPLGLVAQTSITASSCPGSACTLIGLAYTPGSLTVPRTGSVPRYDLAASAVAVMSGAGGMSHPTDPGLLRGLSFSLPNPAAGQPGAVIGVTAFLNTAAYNRFVRINDTRDPALLGDLSAQGNLSITGSTSLTGTATVAGLLNVGASVRAGGTVGAGSSAACSLAEMQSDGQIVARNDCAGSLQTTIDPAAGQVLMRSSGINRVQASASGVAGLSLRDAGNTLRARLLDTGVVETYDGSGTVRAALDGSSGRATLQVVTLTSSAAAGAVCTSANDMVMDGASAGTLLLCRNGVWTPTGLPQATAGGACSTPGALGQESTGVALLCRAGLWQGMGERISKSVAMARFLVTDGSAISKPDCPAGASASVVLIPGESGADYANAPPRNRFTAAAIDAGTSWTAFLRLSDGSGTAYANSWGGPAYNFQAIATTFCDFPS